MVADPPPPPVAEFAPSKPSKKTRNGGLAIVGPFCLRGCSYCGKQELCPPGKKGRFGVQSVSDIIGGVTETADVRSGDASHNQAIDLPNISIGFVDTHCHLEMVLQTIHRHNTVPCLSKHAPWLTAEERKHWRTLGWIMDSLPSQPISDEDFRPVDAAPEEEVERAQVWTKQWFELSTEQQDAAVSLGWDPMKWDQNRWPLPKKRAWHDLPEELQDGLTKLGENPQSWDAWQLGDISIPTGTDVPSFVKASADLRKWYQLSPEEHVAAKALGFSPGAWDSTEMADLDDSINRFFGTNFEYCITQGCDDDSFDVAMELALAHPKVYASFGCHPKQAPYYDDKTEAKILACIKECGHKCLAFGEFGLDYSHPLFGRMSDNRRIQRQVFISQLKVALEMKLPLVIHTRGADRDTLRIMRRWVPRDYKVHLHCFHGTQYFMQQCLQQWDHVYIGFSGVVTVNDEEAIALVKNCPVERMLIETDAPYLPLANVFHCHCGHIPVIGAKIAEILNMPAAEVFAKTRANCKYVYGI